VKRQPKYNIYGEGPDGEGEKWLACVSSVGLTNWLALKLGELYKNVRIEKA